MRHLENVKDACGCDGKRGACLRLGHRQDSACVIGSALEIHKRIGPASTYGERLADSLAGSGLTVEPQESILIQLGGRRFNRSLHPPLVVGGTVLVEPRSLASISRIHRKQVLTYLHLMENIVRLETRQWIDPFSGHSE
jgi:GxxExxY protein